jgi:hypothetical protein
MCAVRARASALSVGRAGRHVCVGRARARQHWLSGVRACQQEVIDIRQSLGAEHGQPPAIIARFVIISYCAYLCVHVCVCAVQMTQRLPKVCSTSCLSGTSASHSTREPSCSWQDKATQVSSTGGGLFPRRNDCWQHPLVTGCARLWATSSCVWWQRVVARGGGGVGGV